MYFKFKFVKHLFSKIIVAYHYTKQRIQRKAGPQKSKACVELPDNRNTLHHRHNNINKNEQFPWQYSNEFLVTETENYSLQRSLYQV